MNLLFFRDDNLHLEREGYKLLAKVIKEELSNVNAPRCTSTPSCDAIGSSISFGWDGRSAPATDVTLPCAVPSPIASSLPHLTLTPPPSSSLSSPPLQPSSLSPPPHLHYVSSPPQPLPTKRQAVI